MTSTLGTRTVEEIHTQPDCWQRAVTVAGSESATLPRPGARVLVLGCGTSYYMAQAYADLREQAGLGETDARVASELPARRRSYDQVLAISRSGTSVEVVEALKFLGGEVPTAALVGVMDSPVAAVVDEVVDLGFADESSVVQTRFATTGLAVLRAGLGEDLAPVIADAEEALTAPLPMLPTRQLVVLATGWATHIAQEAALKCRESAAAWVEAYPAGEYRHGPIAVADAQTLVWSLTPLTEVQRAAVTATGAAAGTGPSRPDG